MGTRGLWGFRKNGRDKLTYNHYDSYPEGLGETIAQFVKDTTVEKMNEIYDRLIMVHPEHPATDEAIKYMEKHFGVPFTAHLDQGIPIDWYGCLHTIQGKPQAYVEHDLNVMAEQNDFILDSLFCEYAYIINLDNNTLEFWQGFQKEFDSTNRYILTEDMMEKDPARTQYYPCALACIFDLDNLPPVSNMVEHMQDIAEEDNGSEKSEEEDNVKYDVEDVFGVCPHCGAVLYGDEVC